MKLEETKKADEEEDKEVAKLCETDIFDGEIEGGCVAAASGGAFVLTKLLLIN